MRRILKKRTGHLDMEILGFQEALKPFSGSALGLEQILHVIKTAVTKSRKRVLKSRNNQNIL